MSERIEECGKEEKKLIINHMQKSEPKQVNKQTKNPQVSFE